ncbi:hypothetical protein RCG20_00010 [Neobacillus sp. PS3-40]|nr:hypothetical protein [Neobacillus sp. PS3-40]WML44344.1 hypothetical protein RCG20_00010 [Neobacillus sp. PS3-40]
MPDFCEIDLDVNVINLLEEMARKKQPRREMLFADYMALMRELGGRPSYLKLHFQGATDSPHYKQEFQSYVGFLNWAEELSGREIEVFERYENWFIEVEKTVMSKSYKMVVLLAMLQRGAANWYKPISSHETAPFFHQYLTEKEYRKRIDFSDKGAKKLWNYDENSVSKLIATIPMTKWSGSSKVLISYENDLFTLNFDVAEEDEKILFQWTKEICKYRLHYHFERKVIRPQMN